MRLAALLCAALLLAGCTDADWDHLMRFGDAPRATQAAQAETAPTETASARPAPAEQAAAPNAFCLSVANQHATSDDFDAATQARMALSSYRQCVAIFGQPQ